MCYIRVSGIEELYDSLKKPPGGIYIGNLEPRHWGQKEFSIKDINENMLTFGEQVQLRLNWKCEILFDTPYARPGGT